VSAADFTEELAVGLSLDVLIFSLKGPFADHTERFAMEFLVLAASMNVLVTLAAVSDPLMEHWLL
jgi:hypothetical protein